nr:hypothetical protein [Tanacetum cinerariifolium]
DDDVLFVKICGYFFLNESSHYQVNSGPHLEFQRTLNSGIRLRFNHLISRSMISTGLSFPLFLGLTPGQSVGILQPLPSTPMINIFDHKVPHKKLDVNLPSRSQIIKKGIPCLATILFKYNLANLSNGSFFLIGKK